MNLSASLICFVVEAKVYVGNLGTGAGKGELERAFSYYGPLRTVWIARNPPGFAFVEFEDPRDAEDSVRGLDGKVICGSRVRVELSSGMPRRSRYDRPPARRPFDPNDRCYECGERGHYAYDCHRYSRRRRSRFHRLIQSVTSLYDFMKLLANATLTVSCFDQGRGLSLLAAHAPDHQGGPGPAHTAGPAPRDWLRKPALWISNNQLFSSEELEAICIEGTVDLPLCSPSYKEILVVITPAAAKLLKKKIPATDAVLGRIPFARGSSRCCRGSQEGCTARPALRSVCFFLCCRSSELVRGGKTWLWISVLAYRHMSTTATHS
ncbi:Serine/arginine-rich splicing factor 7 [Bagarius yarrelli]|uniref:Serine/arginine-rich splicing factor 7 n=1 Tax=Bagarius yarrelli TaxID=175774 RepID=A0A556V8S8_BAGYA|nr:Serine/arginine-rich splicing factor 7 [Bagarius yarrelli]